MNTPTIVGMERSAVFALDQATHNMRRANAAILENTAQLTERVDRLCEQAGIGPTSNSSMSSEANDVLAGLRASKTFVLRNYRKPTPDGYATNRTTKSDVRGSVH